MFLDPILVVNSCCLLLHQSVNSTDQFIAFKCNVTAFLNKNSTKPINEFPVPQKQGVIMHALNDALLIVIATLFVGYFDDVINLKSVAHGVSASFSRVEDQLLLYLSVHYVFSNAVFIYYSYLMTLSFNNVTMSFICLE